MRRNTKYTIILVLLSFAITGVLQGMRASEKAQNTPHLIAQKSSSSMLEEKLTNVFSNKSLLCMEEDILPEILFVEDQQIIKEFTNEKQIEPLLCGNELEDCISWTKDMSEHNETSQLPVWEEETRKITFSVEEQQVITVSSNRTITHKILANDNLYNLAKKYYKDQTKWTKIYEANKGIIPDPDSLVIGQKLLIPDISASTNMDQSIAYTTPF